MKDSSAIPEEQPRYHPVKIEALRVGMYIAQQRARTLIDDSSYTAGLVQDQAQILALRAAGVERVWIDRQLGLSDTDEGPASLAVSAAPVCPAIEATLGVDWDEAVTSASLGEAQLARLPRIEDVRQAAAARTRAMHEMDFMLSGAKVGGAIDGMAVRGTVERLISSTLDCQAAMPFIIGQDCEVPEHGTTVAHAVQVAMLTILVGQQSGYGFELLYCHGLGALFHDIGEYKLPLQVHTLGAWTDEERRLVEQHSQLGLRLLEQMDGIPAESLRIVLEHHERVDGQGYPHQLQGAQIYEGSQLVGALDMYAAMLNPRMYPQPLIPAEAIRAIYHMSHQTAWDEKIVSKIVATMGVFPVGTTVMLNTGQRGMIVMANKDRLRPVVRVLTDREGLSVTRTQLVDLQEQTDMWIVRFLDMRTVVQPQVGVQRDTVLS